jgi:hypothetical protein
MKYQQFEILINTLLKQREDQTKIFMLGIDLSSYNDDLYKVIDILMEKAFGSMKKDWIDWFIYERVTPSGEILEAWDENNKPICYDIKSLWEEVNQND